MSDRDGVRRPSFCNCVLSIAAVMMTTGAIPVSAGAAGPPAPKNDTSAADADRKKLLEERDRFDRDYKALFERSQFAEGLAAAEKMLAINRRVFGETTDEVAQSLDRIGRCQLA